jgi:hypothetical protein
MTVDVKDFVLTKIQPAIDDVITIRARENTVMIVELINALWNIVFGEDHTVLRFLINESIDPVIPKGSLVTKNEFSLNELITINTNGKKKTIKITIASISSDSELSFFRLNAFVLLAITLLLLMIQSPASC